MTEQTIVSVRMEHTLKDALVNEAEKEHRSFSQHVAKILTDYIKEK